MISISISCEAEEIPAVRAILGGILQEQEKPERRYKRREMTREEKAEAIRLSKTGMKNSDIADTIGVHPLQVCGLISAETKKARNSPVGEGESCKAESLAKIIESPAKPVRDRVDERILALRAEGKSMAEIADVLMREQGGPWTGADVLMRIEAMKAEAK